MRKLACLSALFLFSGKADFRRVQYRGVRYSDLSRVRFVVFYRAKINYVSTRIEAQQFICAAVVLAVNVDDALRGTTNNNVLHFLLPLDLRTDNQRVNTVELKVGVTLLHRQRNGRSSWIGMINHLVSDGKA